jgi:hypothetical protein
MKGTQNSAFFFDIHIHTQVRACVPRTREGRARQLPRVEIRRDIDNSKCHETEGELSLHAVSLKVITNCEQSEKANSVSFYLIGSSLATFSAFLCSTNLMKGRRF